MSLLNVEIKARYQRTEETDRVIRSLGAQFQGVNHQIDIYFEVPNGRLKLRQQEIGPDYLVFYDRDDRTVPKESRYLLAPVENVKDVLDVLGASLGIRTEVRKKREFWLWRNVRIFFDEVEQLGSFLELESVCENGITIDKARRQVSLLVHLFGIQEEDLVAVSYSDLRGSQ